MRSKESRRAQTHLSRPRAHGAFRIRPGMLGAPLSSRSTAARLARTRLECQSCAVHTLSLYACCRAGAASVREIGLVEIASDLGEASEGAESDESSGHELDRSRDGGALGGGSGGAPGGGRDGGGATGGSAVGGGGGGTGGGGKGSDTNSGGGGCCGASAGTPGGADGGGGLGGRDGRGELGGGTLGVGTHPRHVRKGVADILDMNYVAISC